MDYTVTKIAINHRDAQWRHQGGTEPLQVRGSAPPNPSLKKVKKNPKMANLL